jgi:hypothetical protein
MHLHMYTTDGRFPTLKTGTPTLVYTAEFTQCVNDSQTIFSCGHFSEVNSLVNKDPLK